MEQFFICLKLKVIVFGRGERVTFSIFEFVKSLNLIILEFTMVEMIGPDGYYVLYVISNSFSLSTILNVQEKILIFNKTQT